MLVASHAVESETKQFACTSMASVLTVNDPLIKRIRRDSTWSHEANQSDKEAHVKVVTKVTMIIGRYLRRPGVKGV